MKLVEAYIVFLQPRTNVSSHGVLKLMSAGGFGGFWESDQPLHLHLHPHPKTNKFADIEIGLLVTRTRDGALVFDCTGGTEFEGFTAASDCQDIDEN